MSDRSDGRLALVTGATGFVGGALCERLLIDGWRVRAPARRSLITSRPDRTSWIPIADLADWASDCDPDLEGVDTVFHLAARVHQHGLRGDDEAYRRDNVDTTVALARAAARCGVRRVVFVSSVKAMADTSSGRPLLPDDPPHPGDAYGRSKLAAEQGLTGALGAGGPTDWCIIRPPLVYGIGVRANLAQLVRWIAAGRPLPLKAVRNRRSLIGRENLADLLARCAVAPEAAGRVVLPADGDWSTAQLIELIADAIGRPPVAFWPVPVSLLRTLGRFSGQIDRVDSLTASLCVDDPWIRERLDWQAPVPAHEGLSVMARTLVARSR
ncbi:MAG: NAD-dependent epimerase/dehydratase family protein [Burkholderiaceae bacterium]